MSWACVVNFIFLYCCANKADARGEVDRVLSICSLFVIVLPHSRNAMKCCVEGQHAGEVQNVQLDPITPNLGAARWFSHGQIVLQVGPIAFHLDILFLEKVVKMSHEN